MRWFVLLIFFCCYCGIINAQIPNANFEEWEIRDGIEEPKYWETSNSINDSTGFSVIKEEDAIEGMYSMKISNRVPSHFGYAHGIALTYVKSPEYYDALIARFKVDSLTSPYIGWITFEIFGIENGIPEDLIKHFWWWPTNGPIESRMSIPSYRDSLMIKVIASVGFNQDSMRFLGHAEVILDGLELATIYTTPTKDQSKKSNLRIYPNPTNDRVFVSLPNNEIQIEKLELYDLQGRLVATNIGSSEMDLSHLPSSTYRIFVYLDDGKVIGEMLVKQ